MNKIYLICIIDTIADVLTIIITVAVYNHKKLSLQEDEETMRRKLRAEQQEFQKQAEERERQIQLEKAKVIAAHVDMKNDIERREEELKAQTTVAGQDLAKREEMLNQRISEFEKEQQVRDDITKKSDRDVVVELHVKTMHILETLEKMENKLAGVKDYSSRLDTLSNNVTANVSNLENSLTVSVNTLKKNMESSFGNMDAVIRDSIAENSSALTEDEVRSIVETSVNKGSSMLANNIRTAVSEALENSLITNPRIDTNDIEYAVQNCIGSSLSDIQTSVSSIESKFGYYDLDDTVQSAVESAVGQTLSDMESTLSSIDSRIGY